MADCPTPDKTQYKNQREALDAWKGLASRSGAKKRKALHPYRCACSFWHLGGERGGWKAGTRYRQVRIR